MKTIRLTLIAACGMLLAGLMGAPAFAGSYDFDNSGYNTGTSYQVWYQGTVAPGSATVTFSASLYVINYGFGQGAGAETAGRPSNEGIISLGCENLNQNQSQTVTESASDNPGTETYTLSETWGGATHDVYANCSINLSW